MRTVIAGVAAVLMTLTLGGCVMPHSKLHEYRETAEQLRAELTQQIPAHLVDKEPTIEGDTYEGAQHGAGGKPTSPASWQVDQRHEPINEPGTSEHIAQVLHDYLEDHGWRYSRTRTGAGGKSFAEGYRRTDADGQTWYIEVGWAPTTPNRIEFVRLLIESPMTVLGTDPPEREYSSAHT